MACGPKDIYLALTAAGFSTTQAIGIMANGLAESSLNPETSVVDSNGYRSYGLWQFNAKSYPNAASLVTGNCTADIRAQVGYLKAHVSGQALAGSTPAQVAGNFAQSFERCATCQPGGMSYSQRVANAGIVAGWVRSGKWPTSAAGLATGSGGSSSSSSSSSSGAAAAGADCALSLGGQHVGIVFGHGPTLPSTCLVKKSEIRAVLGGLLLAAGGAVFLVGAIVMAAGAFQRAAPALAGAADAAAVLPGGGAAAEGLTAAHRRASRSGGQVASERRGARVAVQRQEARTQRRTETAARQQQRTEDRAARRAAGSPAQQRRAVSGRAPRQPRPAAAPRQPAAVHH